MYAHLEKKILLLWELPVVLREIQDQVAMVLEFEIALLIPEHKDQRKNIQGLIDKQSFCFCTKKENKETKLRWSLPQNG